MTSAAATVEVRSGHARHREDRLAPHQIRHRRPPALLVIDVQRAFDNPIWGRRNNPHFEGSIAGLLQGWRAARAPVVHVRHESRATSGLFTRTNGGFDFMQCALPLREEPVFTKHVNCAFVGTDLEHSLRDSGIRRLVIAGLTTNHCCETTARLASNLGFQVTFAIESRGAHPGLPRPDRRCDVRLAGWVQGPCGLLVWPICAASHRDNGDARLQRTLRHMWDSSGGGFESGPLTARM